MNTIKSLLLLAIVMLSTSLLAGIYDRTGEIMPTHGEYSARPTSVGETREFEVTMSWMDGLDINTNFGGWTYDYFLEYYVPAADGYVTSIDFHFSDLPEVTGGGLSVWIYAANYPWEEIDAEAIADAANDANLGYYDEATGFEIVGTNWIQMGVNDIEGADPDYNYDPLGAQGWPIVGSASIAIEPNADDEGWVNLDLLSTMESDFFFLRGEAFIVVVRLEGFPDTSDDDYRMGFYAATLHHNPQPSMKFYGTISSPNGRTGVGDWGWYIRSYVWDWSVNAILTSDPPPMIFEVTQLGPTLSFEPRTVTALITDGNPDGGLEGVDNAVLMVSVDEGEWSAHAMALNDSLYYSGEIPGVEGGEVSYYIVATDVMGNTSEMPYPYEYLVFVPTSQTLVVFNGGDISGYPADYYFGIGAYDTYETYDFSHDVWGGEIIASLAQAYNSIYEITTGGAIIDNRIVIAGWLDQGARNYFLAGDEWFGAMTGWTDQAYYPGDFEYDVLGITEVFNDINADYQGADAIDAVEGNNLTGELYSMHHSIGDTLMYDPMNEIGEPNWLDGFIPVNPAEVNMTTIGRDPDLAIGLNRIVGDDYIVFAGFDPLSINASPYTWWGFSEYSVQTQSLHWYGGVNKLDDGGTSLLGFNLSPAYPNPFNPVTNIGYVLGHNSQVSLSIYNVLGQKVITLMDSYQVAGSYELSWAGIDADGNSLESGLYFYTLQTEDYSSTKKILLLK